MLLRLLVVSVSGPPSLLCSLCRWPARALQRPFPGPSWPGPTAGLLCDLTRSWRLFAVRSAVFVKGSCPAATVAALGHGLLVRPAPPPLGAAAQGLKRGGLGPAMSWVLPGVVLAGVTRGPMVGTTGWKNTRGKMELHIGLRMLHECSRLRRCPNPCPPGWERVPTPILAGPCGWIISPRRDR